MRTRTSIPIVALALAAAAGCSSGSSGNGGGRRFVQVERLAMPAVNEGLVTQNTNLNNFNAITPNLDLNPNGDDAIQDVFDDAVATINAFGGDVNAIVAGFLPDVMRIDTTVASPVGQQAFASAANVDGRPTAGRKLEDDVMDVVLTVATNGGVTTDNVPYVDPNNGNPALGHDLLEGQIAPNGAADFPFLAAPN